VYNVAYMRESLSAVCCMCMFVFCMVVCVCERDGLYFSVYLSE